MLNEKVSKFLLSSSLNKKRNSKTGPNQFKYKKVKTIGLLYDALNEEHDKVVKGFVASLKKEGKNVEIIGFLNTKTPREVDKESDINYFSMKDINWLGKPQTTSAKKFVSSKYDLLINLDLKESFPLIYMTSVSKASFKAGLFCNNYKQVFDVMIDIDNNSNMSFLIDQLDKYLKMINKGSK